MSIYSRGLLGARGRAGANILFGIYGPQDGTADLYTKWLNNRTDGTYPIRPAFVDTHIGRASADDIVNSIQYNIGVGGYGQAERKVSLPLIWSGGSLASASSGTAATWQPYLDCWNAAADKLLSYAPGGDHAGETPLNTSRMIVRVGWEFNHNFQPWGIIPGGVVGNSYTATQLAAQYVTAFQRLVTAFRAREVAAGKSGFFKFEWCFNMGEYDPSPAYPGDAYVDYIGIDFYQGNGSNSGISDPAAAFAEMRTKSWGLDFLVAFAKGTAGGLRTGAAKPAGVSEWAVRQDSMAPYVKAAILWGRSVGLAWMNYWDNDGDYPGQVHYDLSDPNSTPGYPTVGAMLRYLLNPAVFPTEPVYVPNYLNAPTDLNGSTWWGSGDNGNYTSASGIQVTFVRNGSGDANRFQDRSDLAAGTYTFAATVERVSGSDPVRLTAYNVGTGTGYGPVSVNPGAGASARAAVQGTCAAGQRILWVLSTSNAAGSNVFRFRNAALYAGSVDLGA